MTLLVVVVDLDLDPFGDDRCNQLDELLGRVPEHLVVGHRVEDQSGLFQTPLVKVVKEELKRIGAPHVGVRGREHEP
jgi:hypothetical protein